MQRQLKTVPIEPLVFARPSPGRALETQPLDADATVFEARPWGAWAPVTAEGRPPADAAAGLPTATPAAGLPTATPAAGLPTVTVCEAPAAKVVARSGRLWANIERWATSVRSRISAVRLPRRVWMLAATAALAAAFTLVVGLVRWSASAKDGAPETRSAPAASPALAAEGAAPATAEPPPVVSAAPAPVLEEAPDPSVQPEAAAQPEPPASPRQAIDLLIAGRREEALAEYERLARATPAEPSYAAAASILRRELTASTGLPKETSP
ncbi:MAG TPA: hypothetical protein VKZ49_05200 [Polyangiaceae bacterium]|nr:hypothetical protein [Polyangiaceae bacterium]